MRLAVQISGRWRGRVRLPEDGVLALGVSLRPVNPGEMQACGVGDEEVIRGQDRAGRESAARARFRSDAWRSSARQERDSGEIPRSRAMEAVTVKVARKWWLWWLKQRWWPVLCATGAVGGDAGRRLAHYLRVGTGAKADIKAGDGAEVNAEGAPSIGATTVAREGGPATTVLHSLEVEGTADRRQCA